MFKRAVLIDLGSHTGIAAVCFMFLAGNTELVLLARIGAMTLAVIWFSALLITLLVARRAWAVFSPFARLALIALALPGWTVGLPLIMLYALRGHDDGGGDWAAAAE